MSPDTERNSQLANVDQLLEAFFRYKNKVLDQQQRNETNCKLNPTKSHILGMILREERCMAVDVARQLSLSSGATTIVLNQLESEGLIQRVRSEEDRRIVWLSLTEDGKQLARTLINNRGRMTWELLQALTEEEQLQMFGMLKKIELKLLEKMKTLEQTHR
ncbi:MULTISPECIES: MarR family transcriptional regulator [Paenibacillus]|uniref:MarR family winged helix-turn-helix transcriptional regulator n=1 Tax=Paenibacillus TaxID=44249 RepID=UPI0007BF4055|nr:MULTISPECIES: MarR family transcriptional regulator [Paenibacillus]MCZ1266584.1 MarR family transcriptional regulator [Paenibacillus tundrae]OAX49723.1 Transcriptional regulator ZitR [Paenibacillus sp. AD87]SDJ91001.1 DNA-binding transcriptional regulator, MarR family [Paenibacillus sp. OK060]SEA20424.1 DNA-binding transcriptional regulator, MarR family [Paenibacillus sp. 276b]SHN52175.1 DNA-binding transcriptional regulator, MarR family [Paenibacillus sp. ov031]